MPILDDIVRELQTSGSSGVAYLTSAEIGPAGSSGQRQPGDLEQDRDAHIIFWDPEENVLAVDTHTQRNGKIAAFDDFLRRRCHLWLTVVQTDAVDPNRENVTFSSSVESVLAKYDAEQEQRRGLTRKLWYLCALAAVMLALLYYYKSARPKSQPPSRLPQSSQPPLYLNR